MLPSLQDFNKCTITCFAETSVWFFAQIIHHGGCPLLFVQTYLSILHPAFHPLPPWTLIGGGGGCGGLVKVWMRELCKHRCAKGDLKWGLSWGCCWVFIGTRLAVFGDMRLAVFGDLEGFCQKAQTWDFTLMPQTLVVVVAWDKIIAAFMLIWFFFFLC